MNSTQSPNSPLKSAFRSLQMCLSRRNTGLPKHRNTSSVSLFPRNPVIPAIRSALRLSQRSSPQKQISSSNAPPQLQTEAEMIKAIRKGDRTPVWRNIFYELNRVLENAPDVNEAEPPPGKSKVLGDNLATA